MGHLSGQAHVCHDKINWVIVTAAGQSILVTLAIHVYVKYDAFSCADSFLQRKIATEALDQIYSCANFYKINVNKSKANLTLQGYLSCMANVT